MCPWHHVNLNNDKKGNHHPKVGSCQPTNVLASPFIITKDRRYKPQERVGHPSMRIITLADAREELLRRKTKRAKGGKTKRNEVEAMGPASASMPLALTLLNRCKS